MYSQLTIHHSSNLVWVVFCFVGSTSQWRLHCDNWRFSGCEISKKHTVLLLRVVYLGWVKLTSSYSCTKDAKNIITIFLFLKDRYKHVCLTYICLAKSLLCFAALIFTSFLYCFLRFLNIVLNEFIVFKAFKL